MMKKRKYQVGGRAPIYTQDPNDPRLRAYNDSLNLYNDHPIPTGARNIRGYKPIQALTPIGNINNVNQYNTGIAEDPFANDKIKPYKEYDFTHPQEGAYLNGQLTHDIGVSTGYSYKKPVQPVVYQRQPQRAGNLENLPVANIPNIPNGSTTGLSPRNVDIPRAEYDFNRPTKYSFTSPTGEGQNGQKTVYFPTQSALDEFLKGTRNSSSQAGSDYKTATGYLKDGGTNMKKLNDYYYELNGHKIPSLMVNLYRYGGLNLKLDDFDVGGIHPIRSTPTFGIEDKIVKYDRQLDPLAMNQYGYGLMGAYLGTQALLNNSNDKHYQEYKNRWIRDYSMPSLLQDPNKFSSDMYESPIYEKGGLSREQDYGSKSHPYPSVSAGDFAGPHRSYPIPTECLHGDTKIPSLDGNEYKIKDLVGKEIWVYAYDLNQRVIVPAKAHNIHRSIENAELYRIILDNNQEIMCTGNHPFLSIEGEYILAENLKIGLCLMPLYQSMGQMDKRINGKSIFYKRIYQPFYKFWEWEHKMAWRGYNNRRIPTDYHIHHLDENSYNNCPDNLECISAENHRLKHNDGACKSWSAKRWEKPNARSEASIRMKKENELRTLTGEIVEIGKKISDIKKLQAWNKIKEEIDIAYNMYRAGISLKEIAKWWGVFAGSVVKKRFKRYGYQLHSKNKNSYAQNHKIIKIEKLVERADVYDLTVDKYNNFAISAGIFVHNSDARDALRLAHLHGASGVISKVLAKYPQLRKKLGGVINDYMQTGGVFTSQQEINDANAAARGIATRKGLIPGENSYVARRIGDPKPTISVSGPNVPMKALPYTVPNYITRDDIQTYQGRAWYNDPQTGSVVDVDLSVLNQPRFRKTPEEQAQDLAARNAAPPMAYGGIHINPANKGKFTATKKRTGKTTEELTHSKNPTTRKRAIFAQNFGHRFGGLIEGEEHDLSPEQIKRYESLGYEFDYL